MLAGMSDDLYFQVFYGSGEVRYGPEGVDLSEFSSIKKNNPELEIGLGFQYPIGYLKLSALVEMNMRSLSWQWSVERNQYFGSYCRLKGRKIGGTILI